MSLTRRTLSLITGLVVASCGAHEEISEGADHDALSVKKAAVAAKVAELGSSDPGQVLGVRVRKYSGYLNRSNQAEARFWRRLEAAVSDLNARVASSGVGAQISVAELATNMLAEGGALLLEADEADQLSSFEALGLDSLLDDLGTLQPLLPPELYARLKTPARGCRATETNELGKRVGVYLCLSMEEAVDASAALLSSHKAETLAAIPSLANLGPRQQFFWTTYFFNAGSEVGKATVRASGLALADARWTGPADTPANVRINSSRAKFNALWRSVAYDYLRLNNIGAPPPPNEETGCIWHAGAPVEFSATVPLRPMLDAQAATRANYTGYLTSRFADTLSFAQGSLPEGCLHFEVEGPADYRVCARPGVCARQVSLSSADFFGQVYVTASNPQVCVPYMLTVSAAPGACMTP